MNNNVVDPFSEKTKNASDYHKYDDSRIDLLSNFV